MFKAIALDPGGTTGVAIGLIDDDGLMVVNSGQERYNHLGLYEGLTRQKPDAVICERFEYRKGRRAGVVLISREYIGVAALYTQQHKIPLFMQQPSQAIGAFYTDTVLKKHKVFKTAHPHANDAMRHLLQWFTFGAGYKFNKKGFVPGW